MSEKRIVICPYCNEEAILEDSIKVYKSRSYGLMYICKNYPICDAYVGVHAATDEPLGTLANAELREYRKQCHAMIDPLWKKNKMPRQEVYYLVQFIMGMQPEEAHIGKFDVDECKKLLLRFKQYCI